MFASVSSSWFALVIIVLVASQPGFIHTYTHTTHSLTHTHSASHTPTPQAAAAAAAAEGRIKTDRLVDQPRAVSLGGGFVRARARLSNLEEELTALRGPPGVLENDPGGAGGDPEDTDVQHARRHTASETTHRADSFPRACNKHPGLLLSFYYRVLFRLSTIHNFLPTKPTRRRSKTPLF